MPDEQPFSRRHGYVRDDEPKEIKIREDAPRELRTAVINIATQCGFDDDNLLRLALEQSLARPWEPSNAVAGEPARSNLEKVVYSWEWYRVYDFIEVVYEELEKAQRGAAVGRMVDAIGRSVLEAVVPVPGGGTRTPVIQRFEIALNRYFEHAGIGWQLVEGRIRTRGSEIFEAAVQRATEELDTSGRPTAKREIHEALQDLSRRPEPDLTGATHHAMNSLECVARDVCGDARATLGQIVDRYPGLIPRPLDAAVEKAWGYASEMARHIREGREPEREEVELVVALGATVATYLSKKQRTQQMKSRSEKSGK